MAKGLRCETVKIFFAACLMSPCRKDRIASQTRCATMFAEKRCQATRRILAEALAAIGSFIHCCRNCRTLSKTMWAACEVPCPETGVDRRQIITGFSRAMIG